MEGRVRVPTGPPSPVKALATIERSLARKHPVPDPAFVDDRAASPRPRPNNVHVDRPRGGGRSAYPAQARTVVEFDPVTIPAATQTVTTYESQFGKV